MKTKPHKNKNGFVSIFAIFFSAIVISVLTAIYILLLKQIETMSVDSQSFQSQYVADSAFECMIYKEQTMPGAASVFHPTNATNLGDCGISSDLSWTVVPTLQTPVGLSVRARSTASLNFTNGVDSYCAIINTDIETADSSQWTNPPSPNFMTIAGHNKACGSPSQKVVERVIDFYF